jgi:hypothetical protein
LAETASASHARVGLALVGRGRELVFGRGQPLVRNGFDNPGDARLVQPPAEARIGGFEITRQRQQYVVFNLSEWRMDALLPARPAVVKEQRRAVIDQPDALGAHQQVGVARGAIDVGHVCVQPDDLRRELRRDQLGVDGRIECQSASQILQSEVGAHAAAQNVLNLGVRLATTEAVF